MSKYWSYRFQSISLIIFCHIPIMFWTSVLYFFGGFDIEEFVELIGILIVAVFFYWLVLTYFRKLWSWFLPNPATFNQIWIYVVLGLISLLISLKAFVNWPNFENTVILIKVLEFLLIFLGNRKKKTPGGL